MRPPSPTASLLALPTPVQPLPRLAEHLGLPRESLWVKRDDLTGVAAGGNKARKLEPLLADAVAADCTMVVTGGRAQSNHCAATAAAARRAGLECVVVLAGEPDDDPRGNLLLHEMFGTTVVWVDATDSILLEQEIARVHDELRHAGHAVALVPVGGSTPVGCQGYLAAALELQAQLSDVDLVVVATGSGGTHAGLAAGFGDHSRVLGSRVDERLDLVDRVAQLAADTAVRAGRPAPIGEVRLDDSQLGDGYGDVTESAVEAVLLAARLEGLLLEPVYTGKALALLLELARNGRLGATSRTVFWHTGGLGGLLGTPRKQLALRGSGWPAVQR